MKSSWKRYDMGSWGFILDFFPKNFPLNLFSWNFLLGVHLEFFPGASFRFTLELFLGTYFWDSFLELPPGTFCWNFFLGALIRTSSWDFPLELKPGFVS